MARDREFEAYILDMLFDIGEFEAKAMFGALALMVNHSIFALIHEGALWLKTDETTRRAYIERHDPQFRYGKNHERSLKFYQVPAEWLDDSDALQAGVREAIRVIHNEKLPRKS